MKIKLPALLLIAAAFLCLLLTAPSAFAKKKEKSIKKGPQPSQSIPAGPKYKAALLMDAGSGDVLFEENSHQPLPPASMTKLMVAYVTMRRLEQGVVKLDDKIKVSAHASKIGGSQVYLKENEEFTLAQLLEALMIQSANDAAMAIAEYIGGSSEGFVNMMNQEAKNLGMTEASFASPHGLPPAKDQKPDLVSAHDFGVLARALVTKYPKLLELTGTAEKDFRDGAFHMHNHNDLLSSFPGTDGLKTGYYNEAGFCITATAKRNDTRMIAVVMGSPSRKIRAEETKRLLAEGFAQYRSVKLAQAGSPLDFKIPVSGGAQPEVLAVAGNDLNVTMKLSDDGKIEKKLEPCPGLTAPVQANAECGFMSFKLGDKILGRVRLVAKDAVEASGGLVSKVTHLWR